MCVDCEQSIQTLSIYMKYQSNSILTSILIHYIVSKCKQQKWQKIFTIEYFCISSEFTSANCRFVLGERLKEKFGIDYGKVVHYKHEQE